MVGVLALQGDYVAHQRLLATLGISTIEIRRPEQLAGLSALVLPGGESTTLLDLLDHAGLFEPLKSFDGALLGTCAGAILLAGEVIGPSQRSLGRLDMTVERNAYGRQVDSFVADGKLFIRAPKITRVGPDVEVLARARGEVVAVAQGRCVAATYHPELGGQTELHAEMLRRVSMPLRPPEQPPALRPQP